MNPTLQMTQFLLLLYMEILSPSDGVFVFVFLIQYPSGIVKRDSTAGSSSFDWTCYSSTSPFLHLITLFLCLFSLMNHLVILVLSSPSLFLFFLLQNFWGILLQFSVSSDAFSGHSLYHLFFLRPKGYCQFFHMPASCVFHGPEHITQ